MLEDYPPLISTDEYPLHPEGVYESDVWACDTPERPRDGFTIYDWRCPKCVATAQMHIMIQGDDTMYWRQSRHAESEPKLLSWMVARSTYWMERL